MTIVNVDDVKSQISELLARVRLGEEIAIAERDRVVARLVPAGSSAVRRPGRLAGKVALTAAFFDALPEDEQAAWEP